MKVRNKKSGSTGVASEFNIHAMSEIVVNFDEGDCSSEFISDYEVFIESKQEWVDMHVAFNEKDLIIDNHNTRFFEPKTEKDRERGFTLY